MNLLKQDRHYSDSQLNNDGSTDNQSYQTNSPSHKCIRYQVSDLMNTLSLVKANRKGRATVRDKGRNYNFTSGLWLSVIIR